MDKRSNMFLSSCYQSTKIMMPMDMFDYYSYFLSGFQEDQISFFHADDGEDIAEYIKMKLSSEIYSIAVTLYNITLGNLLNIIKVKCVQVIFLTPEVHVQMLEGKMESLLSNFIGASNLIILHHPLIELDKEDRQKSISDILPQSTTWTFIPLGDSDYYFKKALLKIVKIVDKPESLPVLKQFTLAPTQIWNTKDEVFIILRKESAVDKVEVQITDFALEKKIEDIRQISASTFAFNPSGLAPGRKKVEVFLNGKTAGRSYLDIKPKTEMLNRLLHDAVNPIELLCQTLNIETRSRECVDLELNDIFTNGGSNPLSEYADENFDYTSDIHKQNEIPTLLHFAASYGLEQLCTTLLTFPGGRHALKIKNNDGKTPYKLAIAGEFTHLADNILLEYDGKEENDNTSEDVEGLCQEVILSWKVHQLTSHYAKLEQHN
ncbi:PIK3AP1 [Mytilus coruscus]|uniref:PIK3AP1 n=1 Tax=Mytilus coruscus TaxID=42192 RepID=A0A6J8BCS6_MYTCO|nr:PIK3AP1 [Mytilus coruscus]